jgi:hypothetical protein
MFYVYMIQELGTSDLRPTWSVGDKHDDCNNSVDEQGADGVSDQHRRPAEQLAERRRLVLMACLPSTIRAQRTFRRLNLQLASSQNLFPPPPPVFRR